MLLPCVREDEHSSLVLVLEERLDHPSLLGTGLDLDAVLLAQSADLGEGHGLQVLFGVLVTVLVVVVTVSLAAAAPDIYPGEDLAKERDALALRLAPGSR